MGACESCNSGANNNQAKKNDFQSKKKKSSNKQPSPTPLDKPSPKPSSRHSYKHHSLIISTKPVSLPLHSEKNLNPINEPPNKPLQKPTIKSFNLSKNPLRPEYPVNPYPNGVNEPSYDDNNSYKNSYSENNSYISKKKYTSHIPSSNKNNSFENEHEVLPRSSNIPYLVKPQKLPSPKVEPQINNSIAGVHFEPRKPQENARIYREKDQNKLIKGERFVDFLFLSGKNLLCEFDYNTNSYRYPADLEKNREDLEDWMKKGVEFRRAEEIFENKNFEVFKDGIESDDILQGCLGNCYFLSAVAALADMDPQNIEDLFYTKERNDEGCYGVYIRVNGIWNLVFVDDYFPCVKRGDKYEFYFSRTNGPELWVILLEKVWAKLYGSYFLTIGGNSGEVLDALTSGYCENVKYKDDNKGYNNSLKIWDIIKTKSNIFATVASSYESNQTNLNGRKKDEEGIIPSHAYSLLEAKEKIRNNVTYRFVKLRNPWGKTEWTGRFRREDDLWNIYNWAEEFGIKNMKSGEFWMEFDDFEKKFISITICNKYYNNDYQVCEVSKEQAGERPAVFKLIVASQCGNSYIMQHNKNPRIKNENFRYSEKVLAHLLVMDKNYEFIGTANSNNYYFGTEAFLYPGTYYIIADVTYRFIYNSNDIYGYNISTYSPCQIMISLDYSLDSEKALKTCIYNYCKSGKVQGEDTSKGNNLMFYTSKDGNENEFGFYFYLYENEGNYSYNITLENQSPDTTLFYFEGEKNRHNKITKKILPGQWDVFVLIPFKFGPSNVGMQYQATKYHGPMLPSECPSLENNFY